ncbi:MAG: PH domain-containing protein [Chloroflexota bacterium]
MSYAEENLMPGEKVMYEAHLHWAAFLGSATNILIGIVALAVSFTFNEDYVIAGCASFAGLYLFAALVGLLRVVVTFTTTEFAVTNKRVIAKTGLVRRRSLELMLSKVESLGVQQPLLGRMLNYGTITVTGTGGTKEPFTNIVDPLTLRKRVNDMIAGIAPTAA